VEAGEGSVGREEARGHRRSQHRDRLGGGQYGEQRDWITGRQPTH
jgi:cell division inhibitor SepF